MISKILRQIASLGTAEVFGRLFTFAFSALVARIAGIDVLGYLSLALALIAYVTIAGDSGLNQDSTRRLLVGDDPRDVVRESVRIQLSAAAVIAIVVTCFSFFIYGDPVWLYVLLLLPVPIAACLSTPYMLDYIGRIGTLVFSRVIQTAMIGISGIFLLLAGIRGQYISLAYGIGYGVAALVVVKLSRAPFRSVFSRIPKDRLSLRLRSMRRLGVTGILLHLYVSLPLLIAGVVSSAVLADIGLITRIWFLASAPAAMAGTVLLPVMSRTDGREKYYKIALAGLVLGTIGAIFLAAISDWLLRTLFGSDVGSAADGLSIFIFALPIFGVIAVSSSFLIAVHRERMVSIGYVVAVAAFFAMGAVFGIDTAVSISYAWLTSSLALLAVLVASVVSAKRSMESSGVDISLGRPHPQLVKEGRHRKS